jgi:small subunit ribosomal protein S20
MANNPGAKKRIRQNAVRRLRNRFRLLTTRTAIKKLRHLTDKESAEKQLVTTISLIDKCAKANIFHWNKASRLKSHLTKHVTKLS